MEIFFNVLYVNQDDGNNRVISNTIDITFNISNNCLLFFNVK